MTTYREEENNKLISDFQELRKEHDSKMEKARDILKQDLPPFLALAKASRIIGRKEAKKLQEIISKK
ncbi:hypothetical protein KKI22_03545 [Patescibacteria group bacterium]|nr:hypothetical protein [Patescibacteria group bacterium]